MRDRLQDLTGVGAVIVFVGTGLPAMAAAFQRDFAPGLPVLSDPSRRLFELAGMRRGLGSTLRWRLMANLLRALRRGFRQRGVQGDAWQQGGVLVLDERGAVLHRQVDGVAGDLLDLEAVAAHLGPDPPAAASRIPGAPLP